MCSISNIKENVDSFAHSFGASPVRGPCAKPPFSFSCLIFMAIEESPTKRLPVKDIYDWIVNNFAFFRAAPAGWRNSVRHNLSLNKCFRKVDKSGSEVRRGKMF